ncbi:MAG: SPOR domain-containing protein [Bacteroidales bacterium]|nr:SPOR domain-containing protein [Bacteroidales bacterium]
MMKHFATHIVDGLMGLVLLPLLAASALRAAAQSPAPGGSPADSVRYEVCDSLVYVLVSRVDTALVGANIFAILQDESSGRAPVKIQQSKTVEDAMILRTQANKDRVFEGYRVRIFFKESARAESEEIQRSFAVRHPGVPAYRSYANPYFKVTVGDFRTKSEAMQLMSRIISEYPTAFVVKEPIHYPVVNKENTYYVDTVKVYRPIVRK